MDRDVVRLGGREARLVRPVDQQAPDLLEGDPADDLLDVDAAVAEGRPFLVGFGDLGLERDDAFEPVMYLSHEGHSAPWPGHRKHRVHRSRLSAMASTPDPDELAALRREYGDAGLDHPDLAADPLAMFRRWMHDTVVAGVHEPNAMVVSTVSAQGHPSSRMVLLKGVDERGFVFYSNYDSRKGRELSANPHAALLFPWHDLQRQVRVEGRAEQLSARGESRRTSRPGPAPPSWVPGPRPSRAWSRRARTWRTGTRRSRSGSASVDVPLPPNWGGYLRAPRGGGVLAGAARPDARPAPLPPDRGCVGSGAAGAVRTGASHPQGPRWLRSERQRASRNH